MKIRPGWLEVDVRKVPGWAAKVMQKRPSFLEILFEICWVKSVIAFVVQYTYSRFVIDNDLWGNLSDEQKLLV